MLAVLNPSYIYENRLWGTYKFLYESESLEKIMYISCGICSKSVINI